MPTSRKGFSLIELMIVIAVIGILVAVALPRFSSMTDDARLTKARSDCMEIAKCVYKFNTMEGQICEQLAELKGKYLSNVDTLRDPWGQAYGYDHMYGIVFSKGPDGKHEKFKGPTWKDDVIIDVYSSLVLLEAGLETDPDPNADEHSSYDRLYLKFNKAVVAKADDIDLGSISAATEEAKRMTEGYDADADAGKIFRWYEGNPPKFMAGKSPFPEDTVAFIRRTTDPREVCIVFPPGMTGVFNTTISLNMSGALKQTNPFFRGLDETKGAVATGNCVRITEWHGGSIEVDDEIREMVEEKKRESKPVEPAKAVPPPEDTDPNVKKRRFIHLNNDNAPAAPVNNDPPAFRYNKDK